MPIHELLVYLQPPPEVSQALSRMLYNSIHIVVVQVRKDTIGDHFALYVPDKNILFHRLSKLNFLGSAYQLPGGRWQFLDGRGDVPPRQLSFHVAEG